MMCEDCGIRPAKFHLMTIINGDRVERNLCPTCMAKHQKQIPGIDFSNLAGILNSILENRSSREKERENTEYEGLVCEQCGMTYTEFQKCGMLGCANCPARGPRPRRRSQRHLHPHEHRPAEGKATAGRRGRGVRAGGQAAGHHSCPEHTAGAQGIGHKGQAPRSA